MAKIILSDNLQDIQDWVFPDLKAMPDAQMGRATPAMPAQLSEQGNVFHLPVIEQEMATARKLGYDEGFKQGYAEAGEVAQEEIKQKITAQMTQEWQQRISVVDNFIKQLDQPTFELDEMIEQKLVELVLKIARHIVCQEMNTRPEAVMGIIRKVIAEIPSLNMGNCRLRVNFEDAPVIRAALGERYNDIIVADQNLQRGECHLSYEGGEVDATYASRINNIAKQVLENGSEG